MIRSSTRRDPISASEARRPNRASVFADAGVAARGRQKATSRKQTSAQMPENRKAISILPEFTRKTPTIPGTSTQESEMVARMIEFTAIISPVERLRASARTCAKISEFIAPKIGRSTSFAATKAVALPAR
ncbi:hypothetical protein D3C71_727450 [compost metagenome]